MDSLGAHSRPRRDIDYTQTGTPNGVCESREVLVNNLCPRLPGGWRANAHWTACRGPLSAAELQLVEREIDLLATFAIGLLDRIPEDATEAERHEVITELLYADPELFAAFSELMDVSKSNRGSPLKSLRRLNRAVEGNDERP